MEFSNYKFRCSALGKIVSKSGQFTDGNKTYIEEVFIGELYGVRKEAYGKALEKGKYCEEDGITMLNKAIYPESIVIKNKERKSNDFIHGEMDTEKDGIVYDIKNAYDLFTFGKAELTHDYKWQLIGYMWLWGLKKGRLFYTLNNMPEHMLMAEERSLFYKNPGKYLTMESPDFLTDVEELRKAHNYDHMPIWERFKIWDVPFNEEDVEALKRAIIRAREYMQKLYQEHTEMIAKNMSYCQSAILAERDDELNATIIQTA